MFFSWLAFLLLVCGTCVFSRFIVTALIFIVERFYVIKTDKALYFLFALKTSLQSFVFSSLTLMSWFFCIKPVTNIHLVTSTLATFVYATGLWMFKILVLKALDCRFNDTNHFQKLQNMISHEYILQSLLRESKYPTNSAKFKMIRGAFSTMRLLVCTRVHTICDALEKSTNEEEHQVEKVINMVYKNLTNNELRDIQETDLLRVMKKEDIADFLRLLEGPAETKSISQASLRKWMVNIYKERTLVVHLLNNTSNIIEQLNIIISVKLSFLAAITWCHLMGFRATTFPLYITSHLLFILIFGVFCCKTICQGIKLAILMHPFNIGDHCIIDNEQLVVEEIGLISTVFLKNNNEKVICLNSVLLTKSISNLNRTSDLRVALELLVSGTTSSETISALKRQIDELLGSKPEIWCSDHRLDLKGIDNVTHKYKLKITHARNFQNFTETSCQRSEILLKLRKLMKELNIKSFTIQ